MPFFKSRNSLFSAAHFFLLFIYQRQLSGILSLPLLFVLFSLSLLVALGLERSGLRLVWVLLAHGALLGGIYLAAIPLFQLLAAVNDELPLLLALIWEGTFLPALPFLILFALFSVIRIRHPRCGRVEILLMLVCWTLLFWNQGDYGARLFGHPTGTGAAAFLFVLLVLGLLSLIQRDSGRKSRGETVACGRDSSSTARKKPWRTAQGWPGSGRRALLWLLPLLLLAAVFLLGRYREGAVVQSGGLVKPTLFRFDFSDYVKLETEIAMNNDLVLLVKRRGGSAHLIRRYVLGGYERRKGFYREKAPGERAVIDKIPDGRRLYPDPGYEGRSVTEQEYFLINFDPGSLLAMNYPVEAVSLTNWEGSSFLKNYRVTSRTIELPLWDIAEWQPDQAGKNALSPAAREFYTRWSGDPRIRELARELTSGIPGYYDRVMTILYHLKENYYYSLKPGVAADGNQLNHFLFENKRGYCSYFAFSMALLCRSLGIPARVAVGFFIDPASAVMGVYPVRADMAHAWVEVFFGPYGWIEFDPTSERMAPGESAEWGQVDGGEYRRYVEEILQNEYAPSPGIGHSTEPGEGGAEAWYRRIAGSVKGLARFWYLILPLCYVFLLLARRLLFRFRLRTPDPRRRLLLLLREALTLAAAAGRERRRSESLLEWARRLRRGGGPDPLSLAELGEAALYAPAFQTGEYRRGVNAFHRFRADLAGTSRLQSLRLLLSPRLFRRVRL